MGVTRELAEYVSTFQPSFVTEDAKLRVRIALTDSIGIACLGAASRIGSHVRSYLDDEGADGSASVVGSTRTFSVGAATFANSASIHALDFDDMGGCGGHPACSLVPAVLSTCEALDLSGEEFLTAYVAGYEASTAIQRTIKLAKAFHTTSVVGPLGAAMACAWLRRLSVEETIAAISIAATQGAGLRESFGSELKPLQVANGARVGAVAALLASKGCQGDEEILEGAQGFAACFAADPQVVNDAFKELNGPLQITEEPSRLRHGSWVVAKTWPCCGSTHDGLTAFFRATNGRTLREEDFANIRVDVPERTDVANGVADRTKLRTGLDGKFSLRYVMAAAIRDGQVTPESFTDTEAERIIASDVYKNLEINSLSNTDHSKVIGMVNTHGRTIGARVTIALADGTELQGHSNGDSDGLRNEDDVTAKYRRCVSSLLSDDESHSLLDSIRNLGSHSMRDVVAPIRKDFAQ